MSTPVDSAPYRRYLQGFLGVLAGGIALVALFNLWVDPYRLFGWLPASRLTSTKVLPESNIGAIKVLNAIAAQPACVIVGNSRADIGLDPAHPGWTECHGKVYNMAVPGAGIARVRDDFKALVEHAPVKVAVVGVDFQDFVLNAYPVGTLLRNPRPAPERLLREERLHALFTLTGLTDSIATLRAASAPYPATLRADGLNPLRDYLAIAQREGYPSMFRQRLNETTTNYLRARRGIYPPGATDSEEFASLRAILGVAREHGVRVYVMTYPYHAQYYMLFDELGLWPEFEQWKRRLVLTVAAADDGAGAAQFWDFATVAAPARLPVENSGERGSALWYWEAGHFKRELGDRLLDELLGHATPADFRLGSRLTPSDVEPWLQAQRAALDDFERAAPGQLVDVRKAVAHARATLGPAAGN